MVFEHDGETILDDSDILRQIIERQEPKQEPTARLEKEFIIAYVGETVNITCTISGNPRPHRKWLVNDENIYELNYDFREVGDELKIINVTRNLDKSLISCEAWNEDGQESRDSTLLLVNDRQNSRLHTQQTRLNNKVFRVNKNLTIDLNVGDDLEIYCSISDESTDVNKCFTFKYLS